MTDGQYTLDADPMVLARRVETLEHVCDTLCGCIHDLAMDVRLVIGECDAALCETHPVQAARLNVLVEHATHVCDRAHAASVMMGRSY